MELFEKIRRECFEGVGTILGMAKKLGVHRRMVREAIQNAVPPMRKKVHRTSTRLIDRITDQARIIETGQDSYRFKRTAQKRQQKSAS